MLICPHCKMDLGDAYFSNASLDDHLPICREELVKQRDDLQRQLSEMKDPAVRAASLLSHKGLVEAAKNGADLGTCDED